MVHMLATAVVPLARVPFRILVRHEGALSGQDGGTGEVLRGNQEELVSLPFFLGVDGGIDIGIRGFVMHLVTPLHLSWTLPCLVRLLIHLAELGRCGFNVLFLDDVDRMVAVTSRGNFTGTVKVPSSLMGWSSWIFRRSTV